MSFSTDPKLCNYSRPEYLAIAPDLKLIDDELGGTRAMQEASRDYVRKWSAEKAANYNIRRNCETFFEGFGRTLSAAVGMLFASPPLVEWNQSESAMSAHWDNIDAAGTAGPVFVKRFAEAAIRDGLAVLVVDHPRPPDGVTITAANEEALNLRPTWAMYTRGQAISWRTEIVNNQRIVTQLVLHESAEVNDGMFGTKRVDRFRALRVVKGTADDAGNVRDIATWTLFEQTAPEGTTPDSFKIHSSGVFLNRAGEPASTLPIAVAYTGRTDALLTAVPPLLGVAWANLAHWQLSTSLRFNSEVAGLAQPTVIGELARDEKTGAPIPLEIGPLVTVQVAQGGDFKWVEPTGTGLERLSLLVQEKLRQIAALGVSFLATDTRSAETAEAKRLDASAENSTLATAAHGIEDAVNLAWEHHAWYVGIEKDGAPVLTLSRDFEDTTLQSDIMLAYIRGVVEAGLPVRLLLEAWQTGGRIGPDEDLDALEMEIMTNQQAIEDRKTEELAAQQGQFGGNGKADDDEVEVRDGDGKLKVTMARKRRAAA